MSTPADGHRPEPAPGADPETIERDIEATRAELADTVDALSAKLDVRSQARATAERVRRQAGEAATQGRQRARQQPQLVAGVGAGVVTALAGVLVLTARRRRTARRRHAAATVRRARRR